MQLVNITFSCTPNENGTDRMMTSSAKTNYQIIACVFMFIDTVSLIFNVFFLCLFCQNKKKWSSRKYILLLMLVISDLTACFIVLPPFIVFIFMRSKGYTLCELAKFLRYIGFSSILMSMLSVFSINFDLFVVVVKPYSCGKDSGKRMIVLLILVCWLIIFVLSAVCMYVVPIWKQYGVLVVGITVVVFTSTFYFHVKIKKELSRMLARERKRNYRNRKETIATAYRRSFKLATAILVVFTIVYVPGIVMLIYRVIALPSAFVNSFIFQWFQPFTLTNVLWNPILYYYRMKSIRKQFFRKLLRMDKLSDDAPNNMSNSNYELAIVCRSNK